MVNELPPDQKGLASLTLGKVIIQTRQNFPDPRFHPEVFSESGQYHRYGINTQGYPVWVNVDGIGTKPEFAERLFSEDGDPSHFETLAFDTFAMIESDVARTGEILLGIAHVIDTNTAQNADVVAAIARGTKRACDEGHFALLNGETAELGYRASGYGRTRINWNACGISIKVPDKFITGEELRPGQPVVALREKSLRSNGFSKARTILETEWLYSNGFPSKADYFIDQLKEWHGEERSPLHYMGGMKAYSTVVKELYTGFFNRLLGHDLLEQILIPWHKERPNTARELLTPSALYGPLIDTAQGGIDDEKLVDITGAAHISGGGVPEKGKRMVEDFRLGLHLESPFPDPKAITLLLAIAEGLPNQGEDLIDDRIACREWNRGVGFVIVTRTEADAKRFIELADGMGYEAAIAGRILEEPKIEFKNYIWTY